MAPCHTWPHGLLPHMATLPLRALPQSQPHAPGQIALAKKSHCPLPHLTTLLLAPWSHCPPCTWWFCPFSRDFFWHGSSTATSWNKWWCQLYTNHKLRFFSYEKDIKRHRPIRRVKRRNFPQSPLNSFDLSPMYRAGARRGLESALSAQICANNSLCALCLSAL